MKYLAVYATRKYGADGTQAVYRLPLVVTSTVIRLVAANALAWGCVGLYTAVRVVL